MGSSTSIPKNMRKCVSDVNNDDEKYKNGISHLQMKIAWGSLSNVLGHINDPVPSTFYPFDSYSENLLNEQIKMNIANGMSRDHNCKVNFDVKILTHDPVKGVIIYTVKYMMANKTDTLIVVQTIIEMDVKMEITFSRVFGKTEIGRCL